MKRMLAIALSAAAMLSTATLSAAQTGPAPAPPVDVVEMTSLTCEKLLMLDQAKVGFALLWGMGYVDALAGKTSLDMNSLQTIGSGVSYICGTEPNTLLLDAVKRAGNM